MEEPWRHIIHKVKRRGRKVGEISVFPFRARQLSQSRRRHELDSRQCERPCEGENDYNRPAQTELRVSWSCALFCCSRAQAQSQSLRHKPDDREQQTTLRQKRE